MAVVADADLQACAVFVCEDGITKTFSAVACWGGGHIGLISVALVSVILFSWSATSKILGDFSILEMVKKDKDFLLYQVNRLDGFCDWLAMQC